jgi:hypothetical protein
VAEDTYELQQPITPKSMRLALLLVSCLTALSGCGHRHSHANERQETLRTLACIEIEKDAQSYLEKNPNVSQVDFGEFLSRTFDRFQDSAAEAAAGGQICVSLDLASWKSPSQVHAAKIWFTAPLVYADGPVYEGVAFDGSPIRQATPFAPDKPSRVVFPPSKSQ